ncbi:ABC transporter permease subunit [Sutcliffiella horikoshii]|uniref:ABC transporter permease subunit n=1 Tax=Sutcliffiella horikoshii TaxID=79883 RepID=UPI002041523C|nr:ABC transporter permease subunit [Sutcliffiella horikoshii]MCM3619845.1 ABC transporter permease subunit [Sutcliffiella horikoshii]
MKKEFMKISVAVLLAIIFLTLIVFFPRTPTITSHGRGDVIDYQYSFNMEEYRSNVTGVVRGIKEEGTLGGTRYQFKSVEDELLHYYPKSLQVIIPAFILSLMLGVLKGVFDYRQTYSRKNIIGNGTTWLFQSVPDFFLVIFIFFVSITFLPQWKLFSAASWYNVLVVVALMSIYPIMYVARQVGVSLLAQDGADYIKVAKSKGLTLRQVINRHMLRHSLKDLNRHLPTIMVIILSNLLMVEYLSGYQGAAYRLFLALGGVQTTIRANIVPDYEAGVVLGIGLCFLLTILMTQFIRLYFNWKFSR